VSSAPANLDPTNSDRTGSDSIRPNSEGSNSEGLEPTKPEPASQQQIQAIFETGKSAFERGDYRCSIQFLEQAKALGDRRSRLGGEIRVWLVTAYEAAGQQEAAISLCREVSRHPDPTARTQAKRLLCILEAPRLKIQPEWTTPIPDLTQLPDNEGYSTRAASQFTPKTTRKEKPKPLFELPEPLPPGIPRDNQFIWLALGFAGFTLGSLAIWNALG
jgi:tetratricopeptide (TPR) repeat protein